MHRIKDRQQTVDKSAVYRITERPAYRIVQNPSLQILKPAHMTAGLFCRSGKFAVKSMMRHMFRIPSNVLRQTELQSLP